MNTKINKESREAIDLYTKRNNYILKLKNIVREGERLGISKLDIIKLVCSE